MAWTIHESPLGPLTLRGTARALTGLHYPGHGRALAGHARDPRAFAEHTGDPRAFAGAIAQLDEYFAGERETFDLALETGGTAFQRAVWQRLLEIPYGSTITYTQLAHAIGRPDRVRAAAATVGRTPLPILIPCHRVVAADGGLTGYLGGLARKRALLDLERRVAGVPRAGQLALI